MKPPATGPTIYLHPTQSPDLLRILTQHLPHSLPVLRRIQHPQHTSTCHLLATISPTQATTLTTLPAPFAIAFLDRAGRPGIESWLFWSGQLSTTDKPNGATAAYSQLEEAQLFALLATMHGLDPPVDSSPDLVRLGGIHAAVFQALCARGLIADVRTATPARKFLLRMAQLPELTRQLPEGLVFDEVRAGDFDDILASNAYVRNAATLRALKGVGVREVEGGKLVGWVFLGLEGSLRTLHVEERWRRAGLGRLMVVRLLKERLGEFGEDGWAHADVFVDNEPSVRLFMGLGAVPSWDAYWVMADVGSAAKVLKDIHDS